jgi:UDP-3-O-[3-hydroxymyristoyl] glucosamine N-acyltransferase
VQFPLETIAAAAGARLVRGAGASISGLASVASATPGDLVFVEDEARLAEALASPAGAVLAGEFAADAQTSKALLIAAHPRLAFARAARVIHPPVRRYTGVHSSAEVHTGARLGKQVAIDAHAFVGERCAIGDRTHIGSGAWIGPGVRIGCDCDIAANVCVYPGTTLGDRVLVHCGAVLGSDGFGFVRDPQTGAYEKFPQIGRLEIGDDVEIGANCTLDRGALDATVIGGGTKLDNLVHVGHNVRIGRNVVIAAQTGISGSAVIEDNAVIAGQVGIADHVTIGEGVILGAQCGVPSNKIIRGPGELFWGTPARPIKGYLKELAALSRLAKGKDRK